MFINILEAFYFRHLLRINNITSILTIIAVHDLKYKLYIEYFVFLAHYYITYHYIHRSQPLNSLSIIFKYFYRLQVQHG